jgi:hypothetical protein
VLRFYDAQQGFDELSPNGIWRSALPSAFSFAKKDPSTSLRANGILEAMYCGPFILRFYGAIQEGFDKLSPNGNT